MSAPHMNLRGLDSRSRIDIKERSSQYAKLASFMNADPDEIGKIYSTRKSFRIVIHYRFTNALPSYGSCFANHCLLRKKPLDLLRRGFYEP